MRSASAMAAVLRHPSHCAMPVLHPTPENALLDTHLRPRTPLPSIIILADCSTRS